MQTPPNPTRARDSRQPLRAILSGPPVSRRKQRKLGIARFIPGIGYQKRRCGRCLKHFWLGPKQLALLETEPATELVCRFCARPELLAGLKAGTAALTHLGGRGPGYHMQNGRYWGPPEEFKN